MKDNTLNTEIPEKESESSKQDEKVIVDEINETENRLAESGVLNTDLIEQVKKLVTAEIVSELKEDKILKQKELEISRELEDIEYKKYVERMQQSDDPWVDFIGNVRDTEKGQRLQMEWNTPFINYLRKNGITGTTEEEIVKKYITLLLQDMIDREENRNSDNSEFS